jgi:ABC-type multidrug transport system ATPase subunit
MRPLLTLESVSVSHRLRRRSVCALDDVSLELYAGDFAGVWGDRHAGKTTLARVAAGVLRPDSGRVVFDGRVLYEETRREYRRRGRPAIGLATRQGPVQPDMAAEDWIALGLVGEGSWRRSVWKARALLEKVGSSAAGSERWEELSDSDQGRVAIAQAIAREPRVLVVDDPVAGVGPEGTAQIMKLLYDLHRDGVAILMLASRVDEFQGASQIWALEGGRIDAPPRRTGTVVDVDFRGAAGGREGSP